MTALPRVTAPLRLGQMVAWPVIVRTPGHIFTAWLRGCVEGMADDRHAVIATPKRRHCVHVNRLRADRRRPV
jgi:hypothetical protein